LTKCGEKLSILAAPATLDRMYNFSETVFDSLIDILTASDLPEFLTFSLAMKTQ